MGDRKRCSEYATDRVCVRAGAGAYVDVLVYVHVRARARVCVVLERGNEGRREGKGDSGRC